MPSHYNFVAIGDIVVDAFVRLSDAAVRAAPDGSKELCIRYADKVPFDSATTIYGVGNSANAAVAAAKLGLSSALVANVGENPNGRECVRSLLRNGVSPDFVEAHPGLDTNFHYVLW